MDHNIPNRPPSVSRRISLRFTPHPPTSEPTSTLVLNGGGKTNLFTDFRPYVEDPTSCEWAFAGEKRYLADGKCQWTHVVDSRHPEAIRDGAQPEIADVGHCQLLPNGDELETGAMLNPASGHVEPYEEVWRDEQVAPGSRVTVLVYSRGLPDKPSVVDNTCRGVYIQIGTLAQGVAQTSSGVIACRWQLHDSWKRIASLGDRLDLLPNPNVDVTTNLEAIKIAAAGIDQFRWVVVEDFAWHPVE